MRSTGNVHGKFIDGLNNQGTNEEAAIVPEIRPDDVD
jgi:hypothetical protein